MASQVNGGSTEEEALCAPKGSIPGGAVPASVFPLFDPQKRKEMIQQKALASKSKKSRGRATTPTSLSDNEATAATTTATTTNGKKPQTKSSAKGARSKRRLKEDPDGDFGAPKPSRSKKKSPPNTVPTTPFLTPTSSPPAFDNINDLADMGLNKSRRKRRKKTPVPPQGDEVLDEVMSEVLPAAPLEQGDTPLPAITHPEHPTVAQSPKFSVQIPSRQELPELPKADAFGVLMAKKKQEDKEEGSEEPTEEGDEPMLPLYPPVETTSRKRIPVSFDSETRMLTIRSSPNLLPTSPNLGPITTLNLPGNIEMEEEGLAESAGTAAKSSKGRTTTNYNPVSGIFSIKSSPILVPESLDLIPIPESSFSLVGGGGEPPLQEPAGASSGKPPLQEPVGASSGEATAKNTEKRTTARLDPTTGLLIISSPILGPTIPGSRPKSAFSLLGKKKKEPPPSALSAASSQAAPPQAPLPSATVRQAPKKVAGSQPSKAVHPFFKPKKAKDVNPQPIQSDTEEDISIANTQPACQQAWNIFGATLATSNSGTEASSGSSRTLSPASNQALKGTALWDVPWPNQDNYHIRGLTTSPVVSPAVSKDMRLLPKYQKRKERAVSVPGEEDLLLQFAEKLSISQVVKSIDTPEYYQRRYYDVPSDVRLPERIITTGSDLQGMVRERLSSRLPHPNDISKTLPGYEGGKVHPGLLKLYTRLRYELTPFDKSECEVSSWEVKYAPESSREVLQIGKETQILKDWLLALKVESTGPSADKKNSKRKSKNPATSGSGGKGTASKKRKKKKDSELSDFVIDSEEERDEMNEISDPEDNDNGTFAGALGVRRSTIRAGDKGIDCPFSGLKEPGRLVNAVVISGPNGCGKTAAVYAVAKEAGFTVFELSPGMRRNGKDIIDHVGEMSKTHLVHQAKAAASSDGASFFKPKQAQKTQAEEKATAPKPAPSQQQSLILIEEADLIFEEDKQFWTSVQALMAQSKRPIVFTCNDESFIPLNSLALHAVLRFTMPPRDLVIDNLLLMCANEGHLLQRESVEGLVVAHNGDMRASLVELEFWCRMGLGDRKGGLDWMIMRWPEGVDTAENGETLRVVSEDTYLKGMGGFDRAPMSEDIKWRDIWEMWEVDVGYEGNGADTLEKMGREIAKGGMNKAKALTICEEYAEALSAVDVYAGAAMRSFDELFMDSTQPEPSPKARADDVQGRPMLQEDPLDRLYTVGTELAITVRCLAKRHLYGTKYCKLQDQELVDIITRRSLIKQELTPLSTDYLSSTFRPLSHTSTQFASTPAICHSSVNRTLAVLMLDVAPYVRSIARHDSQQAKIRIRASNLLSAGGGGRLTRTARNAGEGGDRGRRDRWLPDVNVELVKGSGGEGWCNLENGDKDGGSDVDGEYELEFED